MNRKYTHHEDEKAPKTPTDVIGIIFEELHDVESELEYVTTDEFRQLSFDDQIKVWGEVRKRVGEFQLDQKKRLLQMSQFFDHAYYQAVDLIDRLRYGRGR